MTSTEIGVIGGVGPAATIEFMSRVLAWTDASKDQDHANLVVLQHSVIPDRTAFVVGDSTDDPGPFFAADAARLEQIGVEAIVVPCNTATAFMSAMRGAVAIPVVDIIEAAVADAVSRGWTSVGVLATDGTRAAGAYDDALGATGVTGVWPDESAQRDVMRLIYEDVKAGRTPRRELFDAGLESVIGQGADGVILGCTELSVAAATWDADERVLDALDSLAVRTVELAGATVKTSR